jgi:hypothetical protein
MNNYERPPQQRFDLQWYVEDARKNLESLVNAHQDSFSVREEFTYWTANYITHRSLYDLIVVKRQLGEQAGDDWSAKANSNLEALLPFDSNELEELDHSIVPGQEPNDDSASWYEHAEPTVVLYIDRWRRWLDVAFDEQDVDDPMGNAAQTLNLLRHIEFKLPQI